MSKRDKGRIEGQFVAMRYGRASIRSRNGLQSCSTTASLCSPYMAALVLMVRAGRRTGD